MSIAEFLHTVPGFSSLSPEGLEALAENVRIARYQSDEHLIRKGDEGTNMHVVREGRLRVPLADELGRLGVTANAIAPIARTRMTENLMGLMEESTGGAESDTFDVFDPANISPLVVWLGSPESADVTGRVFTVAGGEIGVAEAWVKGPTTSKDARWEPAELGAVVPELVARARANSDMAGNPRA